MRAVAAALLAAGPAGALPTDCRNHTWVDGPGGRTDGGDLPVMSWHIHYNTASSDMARFYKAFIKEFEQYFSPDGKHQCPFGPNFGQSTKSPYNYICSLEGALQEHSVGVGEGAGPWAGPQRAFYIPEGDHTLPTAQIDAAWVWAQANKGQLDVLKHPNTGCMHDDHSLRARWNSTSPSDPTIDTLAFPCNNPGTGCMDSDYPGPPSCGCSGNRKDDSPANSCENCVADY